MMNFSRKNIGMIIQVAIMVYYCVIPIVTVKSQFGPTTVSPITLKPGTIVSRNLQGDVWMIDPQTYESSLILDFTPDLEQVLNLEIDTATQQAYILEGMGNGIIMPGESRLVELDLSTNEKEIIFQGRSFFDMKLSPNKQYAVLSHFPPEVDSPEGLQRQLLCILDLASKECTELNLAGSFGAIWVGDEAFIITDNSENSYFVKRHTLEYMKLPIVLIDAVSIPSKQNDLLVSRGSGGFGLLTLNLQTLDTSVYDTEGEYDPIHSSFTSLQFSPDGKFLLFKNHQKHIVVDFEMGKVIAELESLDNPLWSSDSKSLIATRYPTPGEYPLEAVRYDLSTDEIQVITSFDELVVLSVVN